MASVSTLPKEDLTCPVCYNIFNDPVLLACSHSFCEICLQRCWSPQQVERKCPVCRSISATSVPPCNLALRNLCQAFLEEEERRARPGFLCPQHGEKRKLYCMEDQEPMCVVCQISKRHKTHECCPVDEVAQDFKEELRRALTPLKQKLDVFTEIRDKCCRSEKYLKANAKNAEKLIRDEFKRFYVLLQDEERTRIAALTKEEAQKSRLFKDQIDALSKEMTTLEDKINAIETELKAEDIFFLDNYKTTIERAQCTLQDPKMVSESLINMPKHLGNLAFNIWKKMKELVSYSPVILDPNTNSSHVFLSKQLSSVRYGSRQQLPDNPERITCRPGVLGSEGYDSGTHSWDIEVGLEDWELGVMEKHGQEKRGWLMLHRDGKYEAGVVCGALPLCRPTVEVSHKPQTIRVQLDWDRGELSFSDCDTNEHLHTFRHRFKERLFPFVKSYCKFFAVRVMPLEVSVKVE